MKKCSVSVVIPTYNREQLLPRAIESVLSQSVPCDEIIVVDDGSDDNTMRFLDRYKNNKVADLRLIIQENKGPSAARNVGIREARNRTIAFLDSDDHWHKKKLEIQYKQLMTNREYLVSHTKEKWLRRGIHLNQKRKHIPRHGYIFDHCLQLCAVGMSTVMVKKELFEEIGYFDESFRCCEDYDLWLRASNRFHFLLIDKPLTVKEGGREDQVSYRYRIGMDELRIKSIKKLLDDNSLDEAHLRISLNEFTRKIGIFSNGCRKHDKSNLAEYYLSLIPLYREKAVKMYPHLKEIVYG